jgi:hypothetical protein
MLLLQQVVDQVSGDLDLEIDHGKPHYWGSRQVRRTSPRGKPPDTSVLRATHQARQLHVKDLRMTASPARCPRMAGIVGILAESRWPRA